MSAGERLVVARVRGFHGLRGTMRLESLTDRAEERFAVGKSLFVEGTDSPLTVAESAPDSLGWRVRFAEVSDRTAAESLRDAYLEVILAPGEELPRGEFYWHQVVGASVTDVDGSALGEVIDIYRAGGAEVLVLAGPAGELDVPVVRPVVRIFAPLRGEIVVDGVALGLRGGEADVGVRADVGNAEVAGGPEPEAGAEPEVAGGPEPEAGAEPEVAGGPEPEAGAGADR